MKASQEFSFRADAIEQYAASVYERDSSKGGTDIFWPTVQLELKPLAEWIERKKTPAHAEEFRRRVREFQVAAKCAALDPESSSTPDSPDAPTSREQFVWSIAPDFVEYLRGWASEAASYEAVTHEASGPSDTGDSKRRRSARGKEGTEKWRKARKRMLQLKRKERLPRSIRQTAALEDFRSCSLDTVRRAALRSPILKLHYGLSGERHATSQADMSAFEEFLERADPRTRRMLEELSDEQRETVAAQLVLMPTEQVAQLIETIAQNPDAGRTGDCSYSSGQDPPATDGGWDPIDEPDTPRSESAYDGSDDDFDLDDGDWLG
jgi:hypothetical protein